MKKQILSLAVFLVGTIAVFAVPSEIPFGKALILKALAETTQGTIGGYGEGVKLSTYTDFSIPPADSTDELSGIIRLQKVDFVLKDPRKRIWMDVHLKNSAGQETFTGFGSFTMVSRRDLQGRKIYAVPSNSIYTNFQLADQHIFVADAKAAVVVGSDGSTYQLEVVNGIITIPSFISSNQDYWNTIQVTFLGNFVALYDKAGNRVVEQLVTVKPNQTSFNDVMKREIYNSALEVELSPEYGWSPIVEFNVSTKQVVTLDLRSEWGARPTFVRVCTLDQHRANLRPAPIEYDLEGDDDYVDQISVDLEAGNYFLLIEWPTWVEENNSSTPTTRGGKG
jgi:hypothetical protein